MGSCCCKQTKKAENDPLLSHHEQKPKVEQKGGNEKDSNKLYNQLQEIKQANRVLQVKIDTLEKQPIAEMFKNSGLFWIVQSGAGCANKCEKETCAAIKRLRIFLSSMNNNMSVCETVDLYLKQIMAWYRVEMLLNDFIHIVNKHNPELEDIVKAFPFKCELEKCHSVRRSQRNRINQRFDHFEYECDGNIEYKLDNHEQTALDIFDQIHAYFHHTFDTGFRLLNSEKAVVNEEKNDDLNPDINYKLKRMRKILKYKQERFMKISQNDRKRQHNKFLTVIEEEQKGERALTYNFSHRFFYWDFYKTRDIQYAHDREFRECDLYVSNKYIDLKDELFNNEVCAIGNDIWQNVNGKAAFYMNTQYAKRLEANNWHRNSFKIQKGSPISLYYLICIILYCDYDEFSYRFSSTFRYSANVNTFEKLKLHHSNFYWMAKNLRELVEAYGKELSNMHKNTTFYHGISTPMIFESTVAAFCHPTSTSQHIEVASNFATNNGIIIALGHACFSVTYFCASWISAFPNEDEHLFIGGYNLLRINNVINCVDDMQYGKYLNALNGFVTIIHGQYPVPGISVYLSKIIQSLIENKPKVADSDIVIPEYIFKIFERYKKRTTHITIDFEPLSDDKYAGKYLQSVLLISSPNEVATRAVCKQGHELEYIQKGNPWTYKCGICSTVKHDKCAHRCAQCGYDVCGACHVSGDGEDDRTKSAIIDISTCFINLKFILGKLFANCVEIEICGNGKTPIKMSNKYLSLILAQLKSITECNTINTSLNKIRITGINTNESVLDAFKKEFQQQTKFTVCYRKRHKYARCADFYLERI